MAGPEEQRDVQMLEWTCDGCYESQTTSASSGSRIVVKHTRKTQSTYCGDCAAICPECRESVILLEGGKAMDIDPCDDCGDLVCSDCYSDHRAGCVARAGR